MRTLCTELNVDTGEIPNESRVVADRASHEKFREKERQVLKASKALFLCELLTLERKGLAQHYMK